MNTFKMKINKTLLSPPNILFPSDVEHVVDDVPDPPSCIYMYTSIQVLNGRSSLAM